MAEEEDLLDVDEDYRTPQLDLSGGKELWLFRLPKGNGILPKVNARVSLSFSPPLPK